MFSTVGQPVRLAASCPARLRDINSLRAAGLLKKRVCLERRRQRDASAALVLAASLGPGDDSFFSSRDLIADAMLRDIRAFERRMDQLFSEPSTSLEPSWRRDRESSRTIDEGYVPWWPPNGRIGSCVVPFLRDEDVSSTAQADELLAFCCNRGVKGYSYYKESIIVYGGTPAPPFQVKSPSVVSGETSAEST